MKAVVQEEISGCGIASAAALAGVTYRQAQAAANGMGIFAEDQRLWSETDHVRAPLRHFGIAASAGESPFESWDSLPPVARDQVASGMRPAVLALGGVLAWDAGRGGARFEEGAAPSRAD